jgi:hypothetical protein
MSDEVGMSFDLNPQLLEAIQAQSDSSANPTLQALLSQMDPNMGGGALPSMQDLLSQLESTNPTLGLIAKYFLARREQEAQNEVASDSEAEAEHIAIEYSARLTRIFQRLEEIKDLRVELEELRERNDALAAALGACYLCWGEDPRCPVCGGSGDPGSATLDMQMFAQWVAPALPHLKAQKEVKSTVPILSKLMDSRNSQKQKGEKNE